MVLANTLAYYDMANIMAVESLIVLALVVIFKKLHFSHNLPMDPVS
jgi:maltodextrin utilization protein YvdJ